jgi:hypothetical protein
MKFNHNKKRNTAFLYEILILELSKAAMTSDSEKKNKLVALLKENFYKGSDLKRDLDIYRSFDDVSDLEGNMIEALIQEAKAQFSSLNRKDIFRQQTIIINEINKSVGQHAWANFVPSYKKLATINQAINKTQAPKKQILIEKKLVNLLSEAKTEKMPFPNINNLAVKTFINKFNHQYGESLNESQKTLLGKYIMSSNDDGMDFKMHVYEEVDRLKEAISKKVDESGPSAHNLKKILSKMDNYNTRALDGSLVSEIVKIQSLVREISK